MGSPAHDRHKQAGVRRPLFRQSSPCRSLKRMTGAQPFPSFSGSARRWPSSASRRSWRSNSALRGAGRCRSASDEVLWSSPPTTRLACLRTRSSIGFMARSASSSTGSRAASSGSRAGLAGSLHDSRPHRHSIGRQRLLNRVDRRVEMVVSRAATGAGQSPRGGSLAQVLAPSSRLAGARGMGL